MKHNQYTQAVWKRVSCSAPFKLVNCFNRVSFSLWPFSCGGIRTGRAEKHSVWRSSTWLHMLSESSGETAPWHSCCGGIQSVMRWWRRSALSAMQSHHAFTPWSVWLFVTYRGHWSMSKGYSKEWTSLEDINQEQPCKRKTKMIQ